MVVMKIGFFNLKFNNCKNANKHFVHSIAIFNCSLASNFSQNICSCVANRNNGFLKKALKMHFFLT